jgi:hypothetical protein
MTRVLLAIGLLLTLTCSAQEGDGEPETYFPEQLTAQDLMLTCSSSALTRSGRERRRYCDGFVSGVEEALRQQRAGRAGRRICVPHGTTARELADGYIRHASRRATDLRRPAALVVIEALEDTFACTD